VVAAAGIGLYSRLSGHNIKLAELLEHFDIAAYQSCMKCMAAVMSNHPRSVREFRLNYSSEQWKRLFPND